MSEREYIIILYDYYGELLTMLQRKYFEEYYFDNLSLSEISENDDKSRNAIHKNIKGACEKLIWYENVLKLYEKDNKLKEIIERINDKEIKKELEQLF